MPVLNLLAAYGLERALKIARMRHKDDKKQCRPTAQSWATVQALETLSDAMDDLDQIAQTDPVAQLASKLHDAGVSEAELQAALGGRTASPIGNELQNKYRDVPCGWTVNRYGYKISI